MFLPYSASLVGALATQIFFDTIERLDLAQVFLRDRGCAGLGNIVQFTPRVRQAKGQCHILSGPFEQAVIASIAVHLQGAAEAFLDVVCILARTTGRIGKRHTGRVLAVPESIIAGKGPEVSGFCLFPSRGQNRRGRFIHEEFGGMLQVGHQGIVDWG